jgi:glycosyltransferase involved in cell wall biosynthesis
MVDGRKISTTGFVEDLRPHLSRGALAIDPLRIGAGMQNKILVYMCLEIPVVATTVANEGIGAEPGESIVIADMPHNFANRVVELLDDREKANSLVKSARMFVERYWKWDYHFAKMEAVFQEIVERSAACGRNNS